MGEMVYCGDGVMRDAEKLAKAKTHREAYPEQYAHPLCGKRVRITAGGEVKASGIVERVVGSMWGPLAHLEGGGTTFWRVRDCEVEP